jgi:ubiquinone/menaquinone biosynthesis C-methylase UbiE
MAATCPIELDTDALRESVQAVYTRVADDPSGDFHFHRGIDYAVRLLGYDRAELEALPRECTSRFAGVGRPLGIGAVHPGEVVLDHACGAGTDLLLAAQKVGPHGRAIGVDMTRRMREQAALAASLAGLAQRVELRAGLLEALPVADESIDLVISNGVLNLSPDKRQAFAEIVRVLRPGGRLFLADVVVQRELSIGVRQSPALWAACVGGALPEPELAELARAAGLRETRIVERFASFAGTSAERKLSDELYVGAVNFFAEKPH